MRLSALRASTSPPATRGVASTSLDTRARQRGLPVSASSANRSPRSEATATVRVLAPTPAERRTASATCHSCSPARHRAFARGRVQALTLEGRLEGEIAAAADAG
jgi:hypothetical protein